MDDKMLLSAAACRHLLCISVTAIVSYYLQSVILLMEPIPTSGTDRTPWSDLETRAILEYFVQHQAEIGDGSNFKMTSYNGAAAAIPSKTRTGAQVKTKWQGVSKIINVPSNRLLI